MFLFFFRFSASQLRTCSYLSKYFQAFVERSFSNSNKIYKKDEIKNNKLSKQKDNRDKQIYAIKKITKQQSGIIKKDFMMSSRIKKEDE